jgi:hypothetical protein
MGTHVYSYTLSQFLAAFAKLRKATVSFVMSVRPSVYLSAWNDWAPTGRTFIKLIFDYFSKFGRENSGFH